MDLLIEILFDVYGELVLLAVPEESLTRRQAILARVLAAAVLVITLGLVLLGVLLISERGQLIGILPIALAAVLSIAQITAGIVLTVRRHRRSKE